jgi:hypothetical protein
MDEVVWYKMEFMLTKIYRAAILLLLIEICRCYKKLESKINNVLLLCLWTKTCKERKNNNWYETCWMHCSQGFIRGYAEIPQDLTDLSQWGNRTSKKKFVTGWCLKRGRKFVLHNFSLLHYAILVCIYIWSCVLFEVNVVAP